MCLSVPQCTALAFPRLAVSTCKSFDTHHAHKTALREDCTLSRVDILAQTQLREVVLRSGCAHINNRIASCCDQIYCCSLPLTNTMLQQLVFFRQQGWSSVAPFGNVVASVSCESCNRRRALVPNCPVSHRQNTSNAA